MVKEPERRQTSVRLAEDGDLRSLQVTKSTDQQVAYLQAKGYGGFTDIVRLAIYAMYLRARYEAESYKEVQLNQDLIDNSEIRILGDIRGEGAYSEDGIILEDAPSAEEIG